MAGDAVHGGALDGQEALFVADAHAHRIAPIVGDIALPDFIRGNGQVLERKILDQEFAFGFYMHYMSHLDISLPAAIPSRIWVDEMVTSGALRRTILAPGHFFIRRARA